MGFAPLLDHGKVVVLAGDEFGVKHKHPLGPNGLGVHLGNRRQARLARLGKSLLAGFPCFGDRLRRLGQGHCQGDELLANLSLSVLLCLECLLHRANEAGLLLKRLLKLTNSQPLLVLCFPNPN